MSDTEKTSPRANALAGLQQAKDILGSPLLPPTAGMLRGLLDYIETEVISIQELSRPRRKRKDAGGA